MIDPSDLASLKLLYQTLDNEPKDSLALLWFWHRVLELNRRELYSKLERTQNYDHHTRPQTQGD